MSDDPTPIPRRVEGLELRDSSASSTSAGARATLSVKITLPLDVALSLATDAESAHMYEGARKRRGRDGAVAARKRTVKRSPPHLTVENVDDHDNRLTPRTTPDGSFRTVTGWQPTACS